MKISVYIICISLFFFTSTPWASPTPYGEASLQPRVIPNLGPLQTTNHHGWTVKYRTISSMIIPVQVTASVLEEFFTRALDKIQSKIDRSRPSPGNAFTINIGSVFFAFRCEEGNGIMWWAVKIITEALLENVRRGWVTQFKSEWFHPGTAKKLWVSLSILQRIGPGPSSLDD